jgi:hypothetical protein
MSFQRDAREKLKAAQWALLDVTAILVKRTGLNAALGTIHPASASGLLPRRRRFAAEADRCEIVVGHRVSSVQEQYSKARPGARGEGIQPADGTANYCTSKRWTNHRAALGLFVANYNWCRKHKTATAKHRLLLTAS